MSRPASTSSSIRVGAQVYQISLTPAQLEQRHVDKQRERRISRETSKRRKALEERRKQSQLREERERQNELMKRRERQREATERYQRAHIPHQARRRFTSPVLRSPIYPQSFRRTSNNPEPLDATLKEIRGTYTYDANNNNNQEHSKRTIQKQQEFNQQIKNVQNVSIKQPSPPAHPRPIQRNAWNNDLEPPSVRAPSRCDQREESSDEPKTSEEDDLESTFTIQKDANKISRASTPEVPAQMKFITQETSMKFITPAPPQAPRPSAPTTDLDPRMRQIEVLNVVSSPALLEAEKVEKVDEYVDTTQMGDFEQEQTERKSILKKNSSNRRRVVSATQKGLVAASIRDSLDLVGRKLDKPSKSVKWDKLYYNDSTVAEFGTDNWRPVPVKDASKKRGRKTQTPKQQEKVEKGAGKRSSKTAKQSEKVEIKPKMTTYTSHAVVVPTPSSGTQLRTEAPIIKPDYDYTESSRIPMPPTVQRPLTSRTQIIRSKRYKSATGSKTSPMKVKSYNNQQSEGQMIVNSNNQVNIHIGSVEINENLQKTPTDQEINWLWERVRSALEEQPSSAQIRPKSAPKSSNSAPRFSKSMRPSSATINGSTNQFLLAEKMARHGAADDHIMGIIGEQMPVTQLSLEEQQIQESLIRLDNRLNNIQGTKSNRRYQMNGAFQR